MVTQYVVNEPAMPLDPAMIDAGKELVRTLQERKDFPLAAAFWLYLEERHRWRLHLASPLVGQQGSLAAYTIIQRILEYLPDRHEYGMNVLEFGDITAIDAKDRLVSTLRVAYPNGVRVGIAILRQVTVAGRYIEGAYVYFL